MRRLLSFAALTLVWGCAELLGLDEYGAGQESGPTSTSVGPGGGGAGGGPITMPAEVCTDGVDNDNDGAVDCEDDACANHECLAAPPAGWVGPVALAIGDPSALPTCAGGGAEFEGGNGLADVPVAECPCTCDATPTLSCVGNFDIGSSVNCQIPNFFASTANCQNIMLAGSQYIYATIPSGNDPTCGMTSTDPPLGGVTWPTMARGCAANAGAGCGDGVCVSQPAGFDRLCIYSSGTVSCPSSDYTEQLVVERYVMANDTRGCDSPCLCTPQNAACKGSLAAYDGLNCAGNSATLVLDNCTYTGFDFQSLGYMPMIAGSCLAAERMPIGDAGQFDTTTVCCKPR